MDDWREYKKAATVDALVALHDGVIGTPEGLMRYSAGDYICRSREDGHKWPVKKDIFERTYEAVLDA